MKYDICVFGGCALDQMFYLENDKDIKENPDIIIPGGKGANQAVAASRAGATVTIISRIGKDQIGQKILDNLQHNGVFTNNIEIEEGLVNDSSKIYIDSKTKDNTIIRETGAIDSFTEDMIDRYSSVLNNSKIIVAQLKVPKKVTEKLINFCYDNNKPIIITPCRPEKLKIDVDNNKELIDKITYITANKKECETIFNTDDIESCVAQYPNKLIVTLGSAGVMYHNGKDVVHIDSIKIDKLADTTGAGDTFNGNFAYLITQGYDIKSAVERAQYASAMKIGVETAQSGMPYKQELNEFIKKYNLSNNSYQEEFDLAYENIFEAYEKIKDKKITKINMKDDKSFVTESDLIVESILIDAIKKKYPNDNFVTEETNNDKSITGRTWIIDPIDGTTHYMKNSIFFGIQLAFIEDNDMKFSIIYLPKLNEIYYAVKGIGTFYNHKKVMLKGNMEINKSVIEFCGSLNKNYDEKKVLLELLLNLEEKVAGFMHINACCIAFTNLISERTDALILSTKKPWDILPGIMLCKEAGINEIVYGNLTIYSNSSDLVKKIINKD